MEETELVVGMIVAVYLVWMAVTDIRKKSIPLWPGVICLVGLSAALLVAGRSPVSIGLGIGVGGVLFGVSRVSRGGVGEGDAMVYAVTGMVTGLAGNLEILLLSLVMAAVVGGGLLIVRKAGLKTRLPFVPFTLVSYGVVMLL